MYDLLEKFDLDEWFSLPVETQIKLINNNLVNISEQSEILDSDIKKSSAELILGGRYDLAFVSSNIDEEFFATDNINISEFLKSASLKIIKISGFEASIILDNGKTTIN